LKKILIVILILVVAGAAAIFLNQKGEEKVQDQRVEIVVQAKEALANGNYDEAYRLGEELTQNHAEFGYGYFIVGMIDLSRGDYPQGDRQIEKAIQLGLDRSDLGTAYYNLAISANRQYKPELAVRYLRQCLEIDPADDMAQKTLDSILALQQKQ